MTRLALALLVAAAGVAALPAVAAVDDIAAVRPVAGGAGSWSVERMRDARERLKDILPGHFVAPR